MKRSQFHAICDDLQKKMVILVGPRQSGKTHLSQQIADRYQKPVYLNYDNVRDREHIEKEDWLLSTDLLILDEIHKMPNWKNKIKGIYDTKPKHMHFLVTGSARMEAFRQAGDSLAGRFFLHHLLPLSPMELNELGLAVDIDHLMTHSGFPEPFLCEREADLQRWRQSYIDSMLNIDVLSFDKIHDLRAMHTIFQLLRTRVGSPVSYNSLARDAGISPTTAKKYVQVLAALYIVFIVTPYAKNIARSLLKEPKIYFFDTGLVDGDSEAKFENLVAGALLKRNYLMRDMLGHNVQLHYVRTKDQREVDFALVKDDALFQLIEVKHAKGDLSQQLLYFKRRYDIPAIQVVKSLKHERLVEGISILNAMSFLTGDVFKM